MNALVEHKPKASLIATMASKAGMDPAAFEKTMRSTVMPANHTNEQFAALLMVAHEYGLNPIVKEIYAFPAKGGGIVPIVSIDGWINLINSHKQANGFTFEWIHDDQGRLVACTCRMYRKDRDHPVEVTEYLAECKRQTEPWKMEHRMLRHKAMIQAARYAFGFSGIYDEDEGERIAEARDITPAKAPPPPPPPPGEKLIEIEREHTVDEAMELEVEWVGTTTAPPPPPKPVKQMAPAAIDRLLAKAKDDGRACLLDELEMFEDEYGQHLDALPEKARDTLQAIIDETKARLLKNSNIYMAG